MLLGGGLALHLIEPVSALECRRDVPGPAACEIRRTLFHVIPWQSARLPAIAALVAEPERLSKTDPLAVTCTALSLMDGEGDATRFACVRDAGAVTLAQRFFAEASAERQLRLVYSEPLVLAVSALFAAAGVITALWKYPFARRRP